MYYFASDVHLGAGDKAASSRIEARFVSWLESVSHDAKEIWLLGDIFDFWFEYKYVVPKGFVRTLGKLAELSDRGVKIVFLTGNHDMWVRDYFAAECGMEVHTKPVVAEIAGKRLFIAHGDNMAIKGNPVLKLMNGAFRSGVLRFLFSTFFPKNMAVRFGRWWSGKSRKSHGGVSDPAILNPLREYGVERAKSEGAECCIFGHLHLADDSTVDNVRVVFLGDWSRTATYAALSDDGELTLKTFDEQ